MFAVNPVRAGNQLIGLLVREEIYSSLEEEWLGLMRFPKHLYILARLDMLGVTRSRAPEGGFRSGSAVAIVGDSSF